MPSCMFTAPAALPDDPATLQLILRAALTEIERLQLLIAGLHRNRFGRRSEKLDDDHVQRGVEDLEQSLAEQPRLGSTRRLPAPKHPHQSRTPRPLRHSPNRPSATVARCRRICPG